MIAADFATLNLTMEILEQFGIKPVLLAAQVVNFLILLYILKRFLYGPILKVLQERRDKIAQSLKTAEEIEKRLHEIGEKEAESLLRSAKEGEKIIRQSGEIGVGIIEGAKNEAEKIIRKANEHAKEVMQIEKTRLEQELKNGMPRIVALAYEKIMGRPMSKEQKEALEKTVKEIK